MMTSVVLALSFPLLGLSWTNKFHRCCREFPYVYSREAQSSFKIPNILYLPPSGIFEDFTHSYEMFDYPHGNEGRIR